MEHGKSARWRSGLVWLLGAAAIGWGCVNLVDQILGWMRTAEWVPHPVSEIFGTLDIPNLKGLELIINWFLTHISVAGFYFLMGAVGLVWAEIISLGRR
jgi:hypothetical protein